MEMLGLVRMVGEEGPSEGGPDEEVVCVCRGSCASVIVPAPMIYRRTSLSVMIPNRRPFLPPFFSSS